MIETFYLMQGSSEHTLLCSFNVKLPYIAGWKKIVWNDAISCHINDYLLGKMSSEKYIYGKPTINIVLFIYPSNL